MSVFHSMDAKQFPSNHRTSLNHRNADSYLSQQTKTGDVTTMTKLTIDFPLKE